jgi:Fe-S cluster assembly ATP-binding protein
MNNFLNIQSLSAKVEDKLIINNLNLKVDKGEVHAIMGPNGSGKSTLSNVLAGKDGYEVTSGTINFCGEDLMSLKPNERSNRGIFLAFQYPVEIPGVTNINFIKTALDSNRKYRGLDPLKPGDFLKLIKEKSKILGIPEDRLKRQLNVGFSGGEKKRNEALQLLMLDPSLAILDETDSGLDVDAFKIVADSINSRRNKDSSMLIITHYQRLLERIEPDFVHVFINGSIIESGGPELASEIESNGYERFTDVK